MAPQPGKPPRAQVDRAGDTALDHVGGRPIERVDAAHALGKNVGEAENTTIIGRKVITSVQFGADPGQTANDDTGAFDREVVRINAGGEAVDRHAGNALQRLGDRAVRQGADVISGDRVDHHFAVAFDCS